MEVETTYGLRVKDGTIREGKGGKSLGGVSFMASGKAVELEHDGDVFETTDRRAYEELRKLPFLEDLGETGTRVVEGTHELGKAADVIASLGELDEAELTALRAADDRVTVRKAIDTELERISAGEPRGGEGGEG